METLTHIRVVGLRLEKVHIGFTKAKNFSELNIVSLFYFSLFIAARQDYGRLVSAL